MSFAQHFCLKICIPMADSGSTKMKVSAKPRNQPGISAPAERFKFDLLSSHITTNPMATRNHNESGEVGKWCEDLYSVTIRNDSDGITHPKRFGHQ